MSATLAAGGLLARKELPQRSGWILTAEGARREAQTLDERRRDGVAAAVERAYLAFLEVNSSFKELCTDWQLVGPTQQSARAAFAAELEDVVDAARGAVTTAAAEAEWFGPYAPRLKRAVTRFGAGDDRYLVSPHVDSVHTIWFECHEDFLVTLGRDRSDADER
jgi:hypothetical protein